jgi:hypothetical protein
MTVRTPLCHKHAHGWFTWSTLTVKGISEDSLVLAGVSERFVQAWDQQRVPEPPRDRGLVKVRCRSCQSLNAEAAQFCDQCGTAI